MSKVFTAAALIDGFAARYPNPGGEAIPGNIDSIQAGAGKADSLQAAAVLGYQQNAGKLLYVRATEHFFVGAGQVVQAGDFAQLPEADARRIVAAGRAELASDADVAAAQNDAQASQPKGKK